jgi:hypothetical protein
MEQTFPEWISMQITNDELTMIRDYILMPHMLTMVQRSIDDIEQTGNPLKPLYIAVARAVMDRISADMKRIRAEFAKSKIKLLNTETVDVVYYQHFVCRGYQDRFGMIREVMKAEISVRLGRYFAEVEKQLK